MKGCELFAKEFGHRVAILRKQAGISQERLALDANINRTYMGAIERGEKMPSIYIAYKIASTLNVSLSNLFNND